MSDRSHAEYLRAARDLERSGEPSASRLAILSSFTAELLRPALVVESSDIGHRIQPWFAPFGQLEQAMLEPESELWRQRPDVIWLALRLEDVDRHLQLESPELGADTTRERLRALVARAVQLARAVRQRSEAPLLVSNLAASSLHALPLFDAGDPDGFGHLLAEANRDLACKLGGVADAHVLDYQGTVAASGGARWADPKLWFMARAGSSGPNQAVLARRVARAVAAMRRPAAKCLVVDLDHTLWGGVLGDDGLEALQLGDDYPGNAYKELQAALLGLRRRGFLLAIASKNDEATVDDALARHPEMLLRREHFACIFANWDPKPVNLRRIASTLNLGLNALVFIDDNPAERAQVRAELPMVHVVELPADPLHYAGAVQDWHWLDQARLLDEDRGRAEMVSHDHRREQLRGGAASVDEFLGQLGMVAEVGTAGLGTLERIHQLIHKTNQFNLTARRHPLERVRALAAAPDAAVAWLRLRDRYGDLGLVCVGIVHAAQGTTWEIDTLLMSCRVMGRRVETAFLAYLAELARGAGADRLRGVYGATAKNVVVRDFYPSHGFAPIVGGSDGERWFELAVADAPAWPVLIQKPDAKQGE